MSPYEIGEQKPEVFEALNLLRNTIITTHVALNQTMDQVEHLIQEVQNDISGEAEAKPKPV